MTKISIGEEMIFVDGVKYVKEKPKILNVDDLELHQNPDSIFLRHKTLFLGHILAITSRGTLKRLKGITPDIGLQLDSQGRIELDEES